LTGIKTKYCGVSWRVKSIVPVANLEVLINATNGRVLTAGYIDKLKMIYVNMDRMCPVEFTDVIYCIFSRGLLQHHYSPESFDGELDKATRGENIEVLCWSIQIFVTCRQLNLTKN
jgi:hypothetical protein